ncbi:MAG: hypothetical protein KJ906_00785 [Nanoarchaeota archaeon]|nr:hypothetical protein [Nanoarchaeota archaeon]
MIEKPIADEKVEHGWIRVWMAFELLAGSNAKATEHMENYLKKIDEDKRIYMYKKEISDVRKIENPLKDVSVGYSIASDIEFAIKSFDDIVQFIIQFGPSAIEILEPNKLELKVGEAQGILNTISQLMHKFAASGIGGILIAGKKEE